MKAKMRMKGSFAVPVVAPRGQAATSGSAAEEEAVEAVETAPLFRKEEGEFKECSEEDLSALGWVRESDRSTKECEYCAEMIPKKAVRCRYCGSTATRKTCEEGEGFSVQSEEVVYEAGGIQKCATKVTLFPTDENLVRTLQAFNISDGLYDKNPKCMLEDVFPILQQLRADYCHSRMPGEETAISKFVNFCSKQFEEEEAKFNELSKEGLVVFEMLRFLFPRNTKFVGTVEQKYRVGSKVTKAEYVKTMCGVVFVVTGDVIKSKGDGFFSTPERFPIQAFSGVREISSLPLQLMDEASEEALTKRGQWFEKVALGAHFLRYDGPMLFKTSSYRTLWNATGRIMIDCSSFLMLNPGYSEYVSQNMQSGGRFSFGGVSNDDTSTTTIDPAQYFKCWHSVGGFSFRTKKWGEIFVEHAEEIHFDDSAYSQLVLPQQKKSLIHALVCNSKSGFSDIIHGKGNGCIFLLHGPPGTGKTLTAEAVAELLHQPLYSVTCGELGVSTESLESRLRELLDVASIWNAVVLIDEADIFLEQRADQDIQRNAMVGIFLRLLEYHQGIMFLTTNRVRRFDEAFHSRISVALKYPELSEESRRQVWMNLLRAAGVKGTGMVDVAEDAVDCKDLDLDELAAYDLNGRQIRTTIRLAQAIAVHANQPLGMDHFRRNIVVSQQFKSDLRSSAEMTLGL